MITYQNKEYNSSADAIRSLYIDGVVTLDAPSKKKLADELHISVQTVHATITKYLAKSIVKPEKTIKISAAVVQATKKLNEKVTRVRSSNGIIMINDKPEELREELLRDKNCIAVKVSPNQWNLPVTNPTLYLIDENCQRDWKPEPDDQIERPW